MHKELVKLNSIYNAIKENENQYIKISITYPRPNKGYSKNYNFTSNMKQDLKNSIEHYMRES